MRKISLFVVFATLLGQSAGAAIIGVNSDDGKLYSVSEANAALSLIGNTGITNWADIGFAPDGTLYGFTTSAVTPTLYTINPTTAAVAAIGPLGLPFVFEGGLTFAPDGTAYATNGDSAGNPQLLRINLTTGAATVIATISGGNHDIDGLAFRSDGLLIGLDRETNALLLIDPVTAASSFLAAVPTTIGGVGGLTIDGGVGFYNTSGPGGSTPGSNNLYSFNIFTGAPILIGSLAPTITGTGMSGLAAVPGVPEPGTAVLCVLALMFAGLFLRKRASSH